MPKDFVTIALKEEGHGVYSTTFDQTSIAGLYAFNAILDWTDERTGHVRRQERLEDEVKVKADATKSTIVTQRNGKNVRITITPRDQFGNYLGPGYESAIKVVDMKSDPPTDRKQTGTYVFMLRDVPPRTPIKVNVDGVVIGAR